MNAISQTPISGAFVITPRVFKDERGTFVKPFNADYMREIDSSFEIKEVFFSTSAKDVIRGMHFQLPPYDNRKMVFMTAGKVMDVIVDLRKNSATFKKCFSVVLSREVGNILHIPRGCAHGFKALEDGSTMAYLQTSVYNTECDTGILYSSIDFDWGCKSPILSDRDKKLVPLEQFQTPF